MDARETPHRARRRRPRRWADARWSSFAALQACSHIVEGGQDALERAAETLRRPPREALFPLADVTLLAPIPQPPQMRDFLCFEKHLQQAFAAVAKLRGTEARIPKIWYERPDLLPPEPLHGLRHRTRTCPGPRYSERMDFELEFGCYIGKPGKDIPKERAREHIFGYTIFNDFSARDEQTLEMAGQLGPGKGKDFDNANAMGPCLVTADEIGDPYSLEMKVRVNGEEWGRGNSRDMHWKFEDCIAHAVALGDAAPGRVLRLRHRRQRLRPRAHAVPRARRCRRARGREDRTTQEPGRAVNVSFSKERSFRWSSRPQRSTCCSTSSNSERGIGR